MKRMWALLGVFLLVAMVMPAVALAQNSSTCQQYNPQLCSSVGASSAGSLPFTGLDLVLLVAGGGALLAVGFVLRRASHRLH